MTMPTPSVVQVATSVYWFDPLAPADNIHNLADCPGTVTTGQQIRSTGVETLSTGPIVQRHIVDRTFSYSGGGSTVASSTMRFISDDPAHNNSTGVWWRVATANPRTGSQHLRFDTPTTTVLAIQCYAVGYQPAGGGLGGDLFAARISSGDVLTASFYHMWSDTGQALPGPTKADIELKWLNSTGGLISFDEAGSTAAPTAGYTQVTITSTAPAGTCAVEVLYQPKLPTTATVIDVDDWSVSIA